MKKQKSIFKTFKEGLYSFIVLILGLSTLTVNAQQAGDKLTTQVFHIQNYFSEAYLVKSNNKLVLIETGVPVPGYADSLVKSIKSYGFDPSDIAVAIVTHGHGDHAGNAKFLQEKFHTPIIGSKYDLEKFTTGKTELSKSEDVSIWGTRLRPYSDGDYPAFTPDVLIEKAEISLKKYGIEGKIIPLQGGHTPGDLAVLIGNYLFVGDAFVGTFKAQGQGIAADGHHVREHFYYENRSLINKELRSIEKIVIENNVSLIYPTHFGPVTTHELSKYIKDEPTLMKLSTIQTELLKEVKLGKTDVLDKFLSESYLLINSDGIQFSKAAFIQNYITNPKTKIESILGEDFRIVYGDDNTAVMTFIETIKLAGKEPKSVSATTTYAKINGDWKLVFKQNSNQ